MSTARKIIIVICLIVFVGSAGVLASYYIKGYQEQNALSSLLDAGSAEDLKTDKGIVMGKYVPLYKKNPDIIGWISVSGTKINFPVMQTKDTPEYYLRRDFDKKTSSGGTPFMDAKSDVFKPTENLLIYGHNMKNGTMFHDLMKFQDEDFYLKNKGMTFESIYKDNPCSGVYAIFAASESMVYYEEEDVFKYYKYPDLDGKKDFKTYVDGVRKLSLYDTGITPKPGNQLVTLSTCTNRNEDERFFIVGVKVKDIDE